MDCPRCGRGTYVRDTRRMKDNDGIRRRRECRYCGIRFKTEEFIVGTIDPAPKR